MTNMDAPVTRTRADIVASTIVYFLSIAVYYAIFRYLLDAPDWATLGFSVALAKTDSVGSTVARVAKRLGA